MAYAFFQEIRNRFRANRCFLVLLKVFLSLLFSLLSSAYLFNGAGFSQEIVPSPTSTISPALPISPWPPPPPTLVAPNSTYYPQDLKASNLKILSLPPVTEGMGDRIQLQSNAYQVSLIARDAPLSQVLAMIAQQNDLNIVSGEQMSQRITVTLQNVGIRDALDSILSIHGFTWTHQNNIMIISSLASQKSMSPGVQGRYVRVFEMNYVRAVEVDKVIKGLMSPVGQSFVHATDKIDQRNSHEQLVVEDLPGYLDRIAQYIAQIDVMPRQVVVEAHVLQVTLRDNNRHGVNFNKLARASGPKINLEAVGMAAGASTASALRMAGSDLSGLIEALKSTNDTKTLASPKVAVLNGQEARISVGGKLGYLLTTATNTSTLQSVEFLNYGVVLIVTPIITEDGRVLMTVSPTVSTGRINPTSKLPESEATEVSTKVMLNDGEAIVIGGLIKETKSDGQNKVPWLGDLWVIGRLFQSREHLRERNEIIIALIPRISRMGDTCQPDPYGDVDQATTRLMDVDLNPTDRSKWEGSLTDATKRAKATHNWWGQKKPVSASNVSASNVVQASAQDPQTGYGFPSNASPSDAIPNAYFGNYANNHYPIPFVQNNGGIVLPAFSNEQPTVDPNTQRP